MRAVILGAGASKSYGDSPTGQRMPIANDFFTTFDKLDVAADCWVLLGKTVNYLRDRHNIPIEEAFSRPLDIEAIFSEISDELFQIPPGRSLDRILLHGNYTELIYLFAVTVNAIANGPISRPHRELARWIGPDDAIITFNWDVLMDRALMKECRWCVDDGYAIRPKAVFRDEWVDPNEQKANSSVQLLKLHGSANWITAVQIYEEDAYVFTHKLVPESVFVFEEATKPYACYAGRFMEGYGPLTFGYYPPNLDVEGREAPEGMVIARIRPRYPWVPRGTAPSDGLVSIPLIIPPERNKKYGWYGGLFDTLWGKAQTSIEKCDELIIVGYSFPKTDTRSHTMFMNAFLARTRPPQVILVDPAPNRALDVLTLELGIPRGNIDVRKEPFQGVASIS